jgi:chromate transporter
MEFTLYFLRLGAVGFGGPIALAGYMQRDLVDDRKWISLSDYKEGLALAQLAPGPLAAELAIYLGSSGQVCSERHSSASPSSFPRS